MSVQTEYKNRNPSGHWFDDDTIRFFRTRMGPEYWVRTSDKPDDFVFVFVTSEQNQGFMSGTTYPRRYTVRYMDARGEIDTLGPFCELSRPVALRIAKQIATQGYALLDHGRTAELLIRPDHAFPVPPVPTSLWDAHDWRDYLKTAC